MTDALAGPQIHRHWEWAYRTPENERFYEMVFDAITPRSGTILDIGCGVGAHSRRLARRGLRVIGVDVSGYVLGEARALTHEPVTYLQQDACALSFPRESFDHVLCWGVLMHIPEPEKALAELARVLRPGGTMIVSEGNAASLQAVLGRVLRGRDRTEWTPRGVEHWMSTPMGPLVARQAHIPWLLGWLRGHDFSILTHRAGQLTEFYTRLSPGRARRLIHAINAFWFRYVQWAGPAFGNIIIARRIH